jgi:hypothetical protein
LPASVETVLTEIPVAGLVSTMSAPGTSAPAGSVIVPVSVPLSLWLKAMHAVRASVAATRVTLIRQNHRATDEVAPELLNPITVKTS